MHNCDQCGGYLELFYNGWTCSLCRRRYLIQDNQVTEMWWKNRDIDEQEAEDDVVAVAQYPANHNSGLSPQAMPL